MLWKANIGRIKNDSSVVLSDFSRGMINDARRNLDSHPEVFEFKVMDAQNIIYPRNSFDVVIANLMLYHMSDRKKTISDISKILKPNGALYATSFGRDNMKELNELVSDYDNRLDISLKPFSDLFGLENGEKQLKKSFDIVEMDKYADRLEITETGPIINYVKSFTQNKTVLDKKNLQGFTEYLDDIFAEQGIITVHKNTGIFIAKQPLE